MATAVLPFHRLRATAAPRVEQKHRVRHYPAENFLMFGLALALYIVVANYLVFHMHYVIDDAYARTDNAFDVLFTSDPHLAGIGFFWPPLPSFVQLPFIAFKGVWPALTQAAFAGSIESALFSAGTVVLFNSGLRWARTPRVMRWLICTVWAVNPMILIYGAQGMSESAFVFFFVGSILVFLRWSESRRTALLPLLGVLAGGGCLCRNEAFGLAVLLGVGVIVQSIRNGARWREVETEFLLFALPGVFVAMLWIGSMAIIMRDPLYSLHASGIAIAANHGAASGTAAPVQSSANLLSTCGCIHLDTFRQAATFIFGHSFALFPAVVVMIALAVVRIVIQPKRLSGLLLLSFGLPVPLIDIYLIRAGLAPDIRYQIAVIPFSFLLCVYVLRSLHRRNFLFSTIAAITMLIELGGSAVFTAQTLGDPTLAPQEAPLIQAIKAGVSVPETGATPDKIDIGAAITPKILALDKDHGRILCDSTTCFPVVLNAPDPAKQFVVTSDEVFEAAAGQPLVYNVEYFLVPDPNGEGSRDRLNQVYPGLWQNGGGFSVLVGSVKGDPHGEWRLYRITGPTGRG